MISISNYVHQFLKNDARTYGELLENNIDISNHLSSQEKEMYNELKSKDYNRFKLNENKNLIDVTQPIKRNININGIGNVIQIC